MSSERWIVPRLLWRGPERCFDASRAFAFDTQTGRVTRVARKNHVPKNAQHLTHAAVLPGFVNAHSHAFQRDIRGRTEYLRPGLESEDFWSWRQLMYARALTITPDDQYDVALRLYREMLAAGYTTVGEFHYVHHQPNGRPYPDRCAMSHQLVRAATDAGIRLTLLMVLYHTSGIGAPATDDQRRFVTTDIERYLKDVEHLMALYAEHPAVTLGLAPHSIRAVPAEWLARLAEWNKGHQLPVHMHVCEQTAEIEATRAAFGKGPLAVIDEAGLLDARFVGVHATHLEPGDPALLAERGARVCACPSTEANLGDGFLPGKDLLEAGVQLCIGSDSHVLVSPLEELRIIENNERLLNRRRNVLAGLLPTPDGQLRVAPGLIDIGTRGGADALGLDAGRIEAGAPADFVVIDLRDPALANVPADAIPEALVFAADTRCVQQTFVAGRQTYARHLIHTT